MNKPGQVDITEDFVLLLTPTLLEQYEHTNFAIMESVLKTEVTDTYVQEQTHIYNEESQPFKLYGIPFTKQMTVN